MSFLIKTGFWLALILLILPVNREEAGIAQAPSMFESFAAVQTVVSDMRGFCQRNPQACQTGAETLHVLRQKAVYSAGVVQGWLAENHDEGTIHVRVDDAIQPAGEMGVAADNFRSTDVTQEPMASFIDASHSRVPARAYPPL